MKINKNKIKNEDEYESLKISKNNSYENNLSEKYLIDINYLKKLLIYLFVIIFIIIFIFIIYFKIYDNKYQNKNINIKRYNKYINKKNEKNIYNLGYNQNYVKYQKLNSNIKKDEQNYSNIINNKIINEPILPENNYEQIVKEYDITKYNKDNIRYHFHDIYLNREIFKINYSYFPYKKINKSLSYEENANIIYNSTGMLNITKLDYYYYNNITLNTSNYNHINIGMGFDKNYFYMSIISIAGILNSSNINTYIHLHLCINYLTYEIIQKIIQLKRINKNIEFIFYNGKQAELDFLERSKKEYLGIGDYSRVLLPNIVNNTNKLLILDSGDILAYKDLSEVYFFDLEDNYFGWILDDVAGNVFNTFDRFFANNFYANSGVCLVNIRKFRKDNLYEKAFFTAFAYRIINLPYQDIFLMISDYKIKFFPLKYNCKQFYNQKEQIYNKNKTTDYIMKWIHSQKFSPFKYTKDEIYEAALDPVIIHLYQDKIQSGDANKEYTIKWMRYANLTGFYKEIKEKYPIPFQKYEIFLNK